MAGKLQNEDFKTESEITGAGGVKAQLLNDTKIYISANSINKTLDDAIIDGDIAGGVNVIAARYKISATSSVTAGSPIDYDSVDYDTHSAVTTGASWKFTAPSTGKYLVNVVGYHNTSNVTFSIFKNGSQFCTIGTSVLTVATGNGSTVVPLNASDYIDIRPDVSSVPDPGAGANKGMTNHVSITCLSNSDNAFQLILAKYHQSTNTAVSANAVIPLDTSDIDTDSAYSTGTNLFTCPVAGKYRITAQGYTTSATATLYIKKNGTTVQYLTGINNSVVFGNSTIISCSAGDTLGVYTDTGFTIAATAGGILTTFVSFERI